MDSKLLMALEQRSSNLNLRFIPTKGLLIKKMLLYKLQYFGIYEKSIQSNFLKLHKNNFRLG